MSCKKCNSSHVVNKHFGLCLECNNMRLHGSKYGKQYKEVTPKRSFSTAPKKKSKKSLFNKKSSRQKKVSEIELDEIFYEKCFNNSDHRCEECGEELPDTFRDDEDKVVARWRYSHIIAKSISKKLRRVMMNINHLCMKCHTQWDHGDRKSMNIYKTNQVRIDKFLKR